LVLFDKAINYVSNLPAERRCQAACVRAYSEYFKRVLCYCTLICTDNSREYDSSADVLLCLMLSQMPNEKAINKNIYVTLIQVQI